MKKIVRLTESELKNIVKASVRRSLKEGVITEGMLNKNNIKKAAIKLAKATGITVAAAMYFITVAMYGDDYEPATDPSAPGIEKSLKQMPDTISKDDKLNDYHIESSISNRLESRMIRGAVMESIKKIVNEAYEGDIDYGIPPYKLYVDNDFIGDFDDIDEAIEEGERFGNRISSGWDYRDVVIYDSEGEDVWSIKSNGFAGEF